MSSIGAFFLLQAGGAAGGGTQFLILQMVLIVGILYFLIFRPQKQQRQRHEESLRNLQKGDEIVTTGGIVGRVIFIKETMKDGAAVKSMEDQVTIKSDESRLIVERGRIARITSAKRAEATSTTNAS
ncbi:MAG TPA: preprotein translocase subunit YajC [Gemmatimonadaceae bacterium]|nr:preprotein translocase subunit YajC [Gemmatimonadaceae bacterium]